MFVIHFETKFPIKLQLMHEHERRQKIGCFTDRVLHRFLIKLKCSKFQKFEKQYTHS